MEVEDEVGSSVTIEGFTLKHKLRLKSLQEKFSADVSLDEAAGKLRLSLRVHASRRRVMLVALVMLASDSGVVVFATRHAVAPRGSLASGVVDADAVPEERVHRARAEVPGCVLHRRHAHRVQEPAEPETISSEALALLAAADRRGRRRRRRRVATCA